MTTGLVVLVFAIVKAQSFGWGSGRTIGLLAAGLALIAVFTQIERRSPAPLVRLSIFRVRTLAAADAVLLLVASGMFGMFFFASLYVQEILGYSPLKAGLAFLPVTAASSIGAGIAQQLIKRIGVRNVAARRDHARGDRHGRAHPAARPRQLPGRPAARPRADEHRHGSDVRADHAARNRWRVR